MPKTFKIGSMSFETKSVLFGICVAMVGLSAPPTQSLFQKIYTTIGNFVVSIFPKKK